MSVFISWSGPTSRAVAEALRDWLPKVIQAVEPWMSAEDIDKGARWPHEIATRLENARFGIVCVTADNTEAPWLLFEGGALSRVLQNKLAPYLHGMSERDLSPNHPLRPFQITKADRPDTKKLLSSINSSLEAGRISDHLLEESFDTWWPRLEAQISAIKVPRKEAKPTLSDSQRIEQILELAKDYLPRASQDFRITMAELSNTLENQREAIIKATRDTYLTEVVPLTMAVRTLAGQVQQLQEGLNPRSAVQVRPRPSRVPVPIIPPPQPPSNDGPREDISEDDIPF